MREHRILFGDNAWKLVQQEARAAGISAGQFVREASTAYAIWLLSKRGGNVASEEVEAIIERLRSE